MVVKIYRTDAAPPGAIRAARHIEGNIYEVPDERAAAILCQYPEWSGKPVDAVPSAPEAKEPEAEPDTVEEDFAAEEA